MVPLAHRMAAEHSVTGTLDAATLGRAALSLHHDAGSWAAWGTCEDTLQEIKQLWHVLVRFGHAR